MLKKKIDFQLLILPFTHLTHFQEQAKMSSKCSCCSSKNSSRDSSPERPSTPPHSESKQVTKAIPSFLEAFLSDPRTTNLKFVHKTQIHVAILMKRGKVISHATNRIGSRSKGVGFSDKTIHAERNCVRQLGDISQLRGASMYIMRVSKDTENPVFMGSKPCHECEVFLDKCIREYGLKNVYYTS